MRNSRRSSSARQVWHVAYGQWRRARRDLLIDGAIETCNEAVDVMRAVSANWSLPTPATRWIGKQEPSRRLPPERLQNGRLIPRMVWAGPYLSGRRFLART
jgi:hypothetical protein